MAKYLYALIIALGFMASVSAQPQTLSDDEISKVIMTINNGEIEIGQLARREAENPEVKRFAQMMMKEHRRNAKEFAKLAEDNNLELERNDVSDALQNQIEQAITNLKRRNQTFDKAYIDQQINMHKRALDMIQNRLMPNATSPALRVHLEKTQAAITGHINEAKEIQSKLQ